MTLPARRPDTAQTPRAGASDHTQQERLRLIVQRVADCNRVRVQPLRGFPKKLVPGAAGGIFNRTLFDARAFRDVAATRVELDVQRCGQRAAELFVGLRIRSAKADD